MTSPREPVALAARPRLPALDRLRRIWALHQANRPLDQWAADRRRFCRHHIQELRAIAGVATDEATLRAQEDFLTSMAEWGPACLPPGPQLLRDELGTMPGAAVTLPFEAWEALTEAAATRDHPVVRAARVHHLCVRYLDQAPAPPQLPSHAHPLPWALASLMLVWSNYAPLVADRHAARRHLAALRGADLGDLVDFFADLEGVALRGELSWAPAAGPVPRSPEVAGRKGWLAAAIHRRVHEQVRARFTTAADVFRELDPHARARISTGESLAGAECEHQLRAAAERALFSPGPGHWWVLGRLVLAGHEMRLLFAVQDVGRLATGVRAVTADAELLPAGAARGQPFIELACTDSVTLIPTDTVGERWPDIEAFVEETVSRAVDRFTERVL